MNNRFYIKETSKGRGIFSNKNFKKGEIIESSQIIIFSYKNTTNTSNDEKFENGQKILIQKFTINNEIPKEISNITFSWSTSDYNEGESCIALGVGSLFNCSNPANMKYQADILNKKLNFIAIRDISTNEELTVNYSGEYGNHISDSNEWFSKRNIEFIP